MLSWSDLLSIELRNKGNADVTTLLRERELIIADHNETVKRITKENDQLEEQLADALRENE